MSYLVTGATGFIGTNIVEQLGGEGEQVLALSNVAPTQRQEELANRSNVRFALGDVRDQELLEAVIRQHQIRRIIHAAAITSNAEREKIAGPQIVDVNLKGAAVVATAAASCNVEKLTLVSSAGVFATHNLPDGQLVVESQPHQVDTLYSVGKSAAETIVARICSLNDLPYVIGRVATAFGPWEHDTGYRDTLSPIYQLTGKAISGKTALLERDKQSNWHYSRDAASALITLTRNSPNYQDYNLGPQRAWPLSTWCALLKEKYPAFSYDFAAEGNIELYGVDDGGLLSGSRYADEFGPTAQFDPEAAFNDFLRWINDK
ncbi:MAG: hypothetical protein CML24_07310 [Rhizobiales bacterium]|nr:hypothetical protein [Hyphomicrobiales bacterium]